MHNIHVSNEKDMIEGNINRMCVVDTVEEVTSNYEAAKYRLNLIYQKNLERIRRREED